MQIFFSNRIEALAAKMSEFVFTPSSNLFSSPTIFLPNPNLEKWLCLQWAWQFGCVAGINFCSLESGLFQLLQHLRVDVDVHNTKDSGIAMLDENLRQAIIALLLEKYFAVNLPTTASQTAKAFVVQKPFSVYVLGRNEKMSMEFYLRIQQLATKLAGLFREYEYHRPEMIQAWQDHQSWFSDASISDIEAAQKILYLDFTALLPSISRHNLFSLYQLVNQITSKPALPDQWQNVHIFAASQLSVLHIRILELLDKVSNIHIYTLNPCCEYWEDVRSFAERNWRKRNTKHFYYGINEELSAGAGLLSLWGRAGRENIKNLCALTDYDIEDCYTDQQISSNLHRIQNALLTLSDSIDGIDVLDNIDGADLTDRVVSALPIVADDSFRIIKAWSKRDEVAFIARSIRTAMAADKSLRLSDIALLLPDVNSYQYLIELEFQKGENPIIYNMIDSPASRESSYGLFISAFFVLCGGEFNRQEVFDLLDNNLLRHKWDISPEELLNWAACCEQLGVFRYYQQNPYYNSHHFTWQQGLQRMRLALILEERPWTEAGDGFADLPPWSHLKIDEQSLEKLSFLLEKIHHLVQKARVLNGSSEDWQQLLAELESDLLLFGTADRGEKGVADTLKKQLSFFGQLASTMDLFTLDYRFIQAFFTNNIKGLTGGIGEYLVQGVCVSALLPMRPIPFRIIYIAGLEDGAFPGQSERSILDLRQSVPSVLPEGFGSATFKRRDITHPERNQWLFLESLVCAREKLYLCYTGFDAVKDREVLPSAVISQLQRWLTSHMSATLAQPMEFSVSDGRANIDTIKTVDVVQAIDMSADTPNTDALRVNVLDLARFLANPVAAQQRLFLRTQYQTDSLSEFTARYDEPFRTVFPHDYHFYTECVKELLLSIPDYLSEGGSADCDYLSQKLQEIFLRHYQKKLNRSLLPIKFYGEFDLKSYQNFSTEQIKYICCDDMTCFRTAQPFLSDVGRKNLELNLGKWILQGDIDQFWRQAGKTFYHLQVTGKQSYALDHYLFSSLLLFIMQVIDLSAGDFQQHALLLQKNELIKKTFFWPSSLSVEAAIAWLQVLVQDYYGSDNYGLANLELISGKKGESSNISEEQIIQHFLNCDKRELNWLDKLFTRYLSSETEAQELFQRRYKLLYSICPDLWKISKSIPAVV